MHLYTIHLSCPKVFAIECVRVRGRESVCVWLCVNVPVCVRLCVSVCNIKLSTLRFDFCCPPCCLLLLHLALASSLPSSLPPSPSFPLSLSLSHSLSLLLLFIWAQKFVQKLLKFPLHQQSTKTIKSVSTHLCQSYFLCFFLLLFLLWVSFFSPSLSNYGPKRAEQNDCAKWYSTLIFNFHIL